MQSKIIKFAIIAVCIAVVSFILMLFGALRSGDDCWYRYNADGQDLDVIRLTQNVRASGQYDSLRLGGIVDPSKPCGLWIKSDFYVSVHEENGQLKPVNIDFLIDGTVSLCQAYLPKNALTCKLKYNDGKECNISDINKFFNGEKSDCIEDCEDNTDDSGNLIPIPRILDPGDGLPVILKANVGEWRNLAQVSAGDEIEVKIGRNQNFSHGGVENTEIGYAYSRPEFDWFNDTSLDWQKGTNDTFGIIKRTKQVRADCQEGKKNYSPLCGRYSPWGEGDNYIKQCDECKGCTCEDCGMKPKCPGSKPVCPAPECEMAGSHGWFSKHFAVFNSELGKDKCFYTGTVKDIFGGKDCPEKYLLDCKRAVLADGLPEEYRDDGTRTVPATLTEQDRNDIKSLGRIACSNRLDEQLVKNRQKVYSWRSATYATDLKYRFSSVQDKDSILGNKCKSDFPSGKDLATGCYGITKVNQDLIIYKDQISETLFSGPRYLQYMIRPDINIESMKNSVGGYVLYLKQNSCVRKSGVAFDDSKFHGRGKILYAIVPAGVDVNKLKSHELDVYTTGSLDVKVEDLVGKAKISSSQSGYIWFKILNDEKDYKASVGEYKITMSTIVPRGKFISKVLNPIIRIFENKIANASKTMFKNITCYQQNDKSRCTNFFNYIRAMLTLYIMGCGFAFMLGAVNFTAKELVIRIVKVIIVSGLINEGTFNFFNAYLYDLIMNFSKQLMVNVSGYEYDQNIGTFLFLDELMSKIFFNKTFYVQLLSLLSMGLMGVVYYIIIFVPIILIIISLLKTIMVYLVSTTAVALLVGLAPLFLSFMLFNRTWYLFDNWVRMLFRYLIEPVILMAGITILTQLFIVYLDFVLGYSVCWKCAIVFKLPKIDALGGVLGSYGGQELFCINWFGPWGYDNRADNNIGLAMNYIIALVIIAYCMYSYIDFSSLMVDILTAGGAGGIAPSVGHVAPQVWDTAVQWTEKAVMKVASIGKKGSFAVRKGIGKGISHAKSKYSSSQTEKSKDKDNVVNRRTNLENKSLNDKRGSAIRGKNSNVENVKPNQNTYLRVNNQEIDLNSPKPSHNESSVRRHDLNKKNFENND
ncbi:type IV secretion system protein [Orientia tsutsugamushi]|uniref:Type IV secretion system protein n=1 Tax=Orientia tsutsugamushi (strain Boryong) TaxID=357244 RepID=A5CFB3_ORITB|nr:type IV secretion system protein [Orientia tsutsugamushi]CAM81048.1 type IV secretion system protein [Orientia tsutsugamushi str. Boryong]